MRASEEPRGDATAMISTVGQIGRIPVRNLWLLMLYASDLFRHQGRQEQGLDDNPDEIADLVAEILTHFVEKRLKRNLSYGYIPREDDLRRVRGRIDLLRTESHQLLQRGKIACRFEELSVNTPRNRYVRAALHKLAQLPLLDSDLAHRCRTQAHIFERMGVDQNRPDWSEVSANRIGRHDADDRGMLDAAHLALNLALPMEEAGDQYLLSPYRGALWVWRLFEKAVAGFYEVTLERHGWKVSAGQWQHWQIESRSDEIENILPNMQTDIILEHREQNRRIIIDTKFAAILGDASYYRGETLKSSYLYQIYSYVRSQEKAEDPLSLNAEGLLLHPSTGLSVNEHAVIQGHKIRFATVDLAADTATIRADLFRAIGVDNPD